MVRKLYTFILLFITLFISGCTAKILEFDETEVKMAINTTYQLKPKYDLSKIVYESINEEIVSVSSDGLVEALSSGEALVAASYKKQKVEITFLVYELSGQLNVYFIDVGQGDAIFISLPNNQTMMIDAGYGFDYKSKAQRNITSILDQELCNKIDHFVISHNHEDHYGFVPLIINDYGIVNLYGSGSKRENSQYLSIMKSIEQAGLDYLVLEVGDILVQESDLFIQVVATQRLENDSDPNISSVMIRIVYGETAFMFTGDGGYKNSRDAEYIALSSGLDLQADVLKVGHHGSRYSSSREFLQAISPRYAILTTAENSRDGLPTFDAIRRLELVGASLYQTKDLGTIKVTSDGLNIKISGGIS